MSMLGASLRDRYCVYRNSRHSLLGPEAPFASTALTRQRPGWVPTKRNVATASFTRTVPPIKPFSDARPRLSLKSHSTNYAGAPGTAAQTTVVSRG